MTIDQNQSAVETCRTCGQLLDISAMSPLSVVACPVCSTSTTVLRRLGPFQLERLIGQGGMGMVYQAQDLALKRAVAIKVLHRSWSHDQTLTDQFEHEAAMTARINHPNVVRVYSTGSSHGMFYIAMELVDHGSLDSWMSRSGRVPETALLQIAIQVAEGLQAAYRAGLIHRDIKPGNILFAENQLAKIVDFGLALHSSENTKSTGEIWGTPDYIAPEALAAKHEDFRSDMYALGATLWHALTGKPPHETDSTSISELLELKKHTVKLPKDSKEIHALTKTAIQRTLAFRPEDRYEDYETFIAALKLALESLDPDSRHHSATVVKKSASLVVPIVAGTLLLAGLGGAALWKAKKRADTRIAPVNEAYVSDEIRLNSANTLLAEGKIDESIPLLELILRSPDLSPKLTAWCKISLATAYTLQGKSGLRAPLLQGLSMTEIPGDAPLSNFLHSLPGVAPGVKGKPDPDETREAIRQLWIGFYHIASKNWTAAKGPISAASHFSPPAQGEAEAIALLPLAKRALVDLETLKNIEVKAALAASRKDGPGVYRDLESETHAGIHIPQIRNGALEIIAQAKTGTKKAPEPAPSPTPPPAPTPPPVAETKSVTPVQIPAPKSDSLAKQRFDILRKEVAEMASLFRFQAATKKVGDFVTDYPDFAQRANVLIHQIRACALLFEWAIRDIQNAQTPRPFPTLRSGVPFPARPVKADATSIFLSTENGSSTSFEWKEISPIYLLTLATHSLPTLPTAAARAELLWLAGNFQFILGSTEKGLNTLKQAAELNPAYADALKAIAEL
ncbi:MAG: serine/threonine-protein kinase [Verrucomicrobiota bacterium]